MEQRLRLVQGGQPARSDKRISERRRVAVPGQIVWKDARGNTKLVSVVTRDVSDHGVSVQCLGGAVIPLYRLVYFQVDREARHRPDLPAALRKPNVLSAIFRVGGTSAIATAPSEYALRLLVTERNAARDLAPVSPPGAVYLERLSPGMRPADTNYSPAGPGNALRPSSGPRACPWLLTHRSIAEIRPPRA